MKKQSSTIEEPQEKLLSIDSIAKKDIKSTLGELPQWVIWTLTSADKDGKRKKKPLQAGSAKGASSTNPDTWSTLDTVEATTAYKNRKQKGFVFTKDDPYLFIDLDHVLNKDKTFKEDCQWAEHIVEELASYTEVSPSGDGLHIFCEAPFPEGLQNKTVFEDGTALEIYSHSRFSTVTENIFNGYDEVKQVSTDILFNYADPVAVKSTKLAPKGSRKSVLSVDEIIAKLKEAGHWSEDGYNTSDQSSADMALANHIAFFCNGDYPVFEKVFLQHPFGKRDKVSKRIDYLPRTFDSVMKNKEQFYQPQGEHSLEEVMNIIKDLKKFDGEGIQLAIDAIKTLDSPIDEDMAIEALKDTAKKNNTKLNKTAIKKAVTKSSKEDYPTIEELEKELGGIRMVLIGATLKILKWTENVYAKNKKLYSTKIFSLINPASMSLYYTGEKGSLFEQWLYHEHRPTYDGVTFIPHGKSTVRNSVNIWGGYSCKAVEGDVSPFMELLENVACGGNKKQSDYLKGYIAHQFQNPTEKPGVAIVLKGAKGIGKDTLFDSIGGLYNDAYMPVATKTQVTGQFNGHLANLMMLSVAEQVFAGSHAEDSVMKNLLTNPILTMEKKGVDAVTVGSYLRVYMSSNEDWVVPATGDERRYFVPDTSEIHKQDTAYFAEYWKWYEMEGNRQYFTGLETMILKTSMYEYILRQNLP